MSCFIKYILYFFVMFMSFQARAMRAQEFDHTASFNEPMRKTYLSLKNSSDTELLNKFKACCLNGDSIDAGIEAELCNIVRNEAGRETLLVVTARLYPYVECARSLERLSNAIPYSEQTEAVDKVKKAKLVVLLCKALGVQGADVFMTAINIENFLQKLKMDPVIFPEPTELCQRKLLLQIFDCKIYSDNSKKETYILQEVNLWWNDTVLAEVKRQLSTLRKGMFRLSRGASTEYRCGSSARLPEIVLSNVQPSIRARCITGPLLYDIIDNVEIPVCYSLSDRDLSPACGLHHEMFHHLVVDLEEEGFPAFGELLKVIKFEVDGSYLLELGNIYTSMTEFRNIIGIFASSTGVLYFDPCSEAAYRCAEGECIRGTHKSNAVTISYIPVSFVKLLTRSISGLKIESSKIKSGVRVSNWC